jgi:hypothetical protein
LDEEFPKSLVFLFAVIVYFETVDLGFGVKPVDTPSD